MVKPIGARPQASRYYVGDKVTELIFSSMERAAFFRAYIHLQPTVYLRPFWEELRLTYIYIRPLMVHGFQAEYDAKVAKLDISVNNQIGKLYYQQQLGMQSRIPLELLREMDAFQQGIIERMHVAQFWIPYRETRGATALKKEFMGVGT